MNLPDQFLQPGSLVTLSGSAILVWLVSGGLRYFLGFFRKWLPLAISAVVIIIVQGMSTSAITPMQVLLLIGNTFLLAFTAVGLNKTVAREAEEPRTEGQSKRQPAFRGSWFD